MLCAILLSVLAVVAGIVFWISILFLIIKSVKKQPKKRNIILSCGSAFAWLVFMILVLVFGVKELVNGDSFVDKIAENIGEATANIAEHSYEGIKKGWNKSLVKKVNMLQVKFVSMEKIEKSDNQFYDFADTNGKSIYEIVLALNNPLAQSKKISYRKINKEQLVFARDIDGNYVPCFLIDDSGLSTIPWIFPIFLPSYRKDRGSENIPSGKSLLRIRLDLESRNSIDSVFFGEQEIKIPHEETLLMESVS